ncbi:MAG TPA: response regulator [Candidatus Binataceae bacterium]|nr:response regulator [Candidatus Binataceae bacterium]
MAVRVLIADSSGVTRDIIRHHLECGGCEIVGETKTVEQALNLFRTARPDVVMLDPGLNSTDHGDPLKMFRTIREESPSTSVIVVSASRSPETQRLFLREGALDCVVEPFDSRGFENMWRKLSKIYPELDRRQPVMAGSAAGARAMRA